MTHTISIRTISIFAAIIGIIALALMAAYGNPAQGQSTPSVGFESSNISPTIQEPDLSPYRVNVTFNVELSQASSQTITVRYHTVDETAHAAQRDYTATSGTLYFSPGTTQRTITVTVLNDTNVENFERFGVELSQPTNATIGANNEVVIIIADNDESAPYNLIAPATVRENQGTFTFSVKTASSPRVEKTARLLIYSTPGTAEVGDDYTYFSKIVALEPGTTGSNFTVALGNDDTDEPDETFFLRLFHPGTTDPQIILGVTEVTVTILDDDPAVPTNLELASQTTDDDLDHVAVLQWDYSDAEGYLLESRDGASGDWNCIVAGTYSSREPSGTSTVSGRGEWMDHQGWSHGRQLQLALQGHRAGNFTSQEFSYPGEATCDEDENEDGKPDYGYIFSTVVDQGYNLSPADTLGPVAIPAIDPTVAPTWQPTGLTIAAGAKHRDVQISWDEPPAGSNVTGFALYRKWNGHDDAPHLCLYWSTKPSEFITSYRDTLIAAYETASNRNKYVYTVYPLNEAVPSTRRAPGGCDDYQPDNMFLSASVTATLAISTDIFENSDGDLEYLNPPAPTGLTLETRFRGYRSDISTIIATWEDVGNAPGYKVRWA